MASKPKPITRRVKTGAKPRGKPFQKGADTRRGPGSRAKTEDTILTEWVRYFSANTGSQNAMACETYAKEFRKAGDQLPIIALIAARLVLGLMDDPDPRILQQVWDRLDGKLGDSLALTGEAGKPLQIGIVALDYRNLLTPLAPRSMGNISAPREDEVLRDGEEIREVGNG